MTVQEVKPSSRPYAFSRMTRRMLLRRAVMVGFAAPAISTLLAACGDDDTEITAEEVMDDEPEEEPAQADDEPEAEEDEEPEEEVVNEGGTLNIAWNAAPPNFNPVTAVSRAQAWFFYSVMSSLAKANPEAQEYEPDLAESWEIEEEGSSYTFVIRQNAAWHDGEPVTAHDVAMTYTLALDSATESRLTGRLSLINGAEAYTNDEVDEVVGIQVSDDRAITFDMEFPNGLFLNESGLAILPEHILGSVDPGELSEHAFFFDSPLGSGPFKFVRYQADQLLEVEANSDYHFGRPGLAGIVYHIIESPDTIAIAMGREEIDMPVFDAGTGETELFERYVDDERFRIDGTAGTSVLAYGWNSRVEDLRDPRIRQAFLFALDRERLVSAFNANNGTIFNSFMTHEWYQRPEWADLYPFDPDRARELLDEAGWDSGRVVTANSLTFANEAVRAQAAAEQQMLADVGFNIEFRELEISAGIEALYETYDFELYRVTFGVFPDPDGFLSFHMSTGSANALGYANPELDEKIQLGRRTVDQEERVPIYQEINEEMLETLPLTPIYMENMWWVRSKAWHVPLLDDLPQATSLTDIPILPSLGTALDVWGHHQEQWRKE